MRKKRETATPSPADRVRAAGLRRTGPRVAVLERLGRAKAPLTHGEIYADLKDLGFDQATIYRNLVDLTEAGLVTRTDLGDHKWRFELRDEAAQHGRQHPHFVCTDCGQVSCLPDVKVQITRMPGARRGVRTSELEVQLKGLCERCHA